MDEKAVITSALPNKCALLGYPMENSHGIAMGIWVKTGGRFENKEQKGIAHFLEHMVFKGSRKYGIKRIKSLTEGVGGVLNGYTSQEATCYYIKIPPQYGKKAFDVICDMVFHPKLDKTEFEKERNVILEEIKMYKDLPNYYSLDLCQMLAWKGSVLGLPLAGDLDTVRGIRLNDMRIFHKQFYNPSNSCIVFAGREAPRLMQYAREVFSSARKAAKGPSKVQRFKNSQKNFRCMIEQRKTEQAHLALGFHAFDAFDQRRYALAVFNVAVGGNMSSRLFNSIREKRGLAYSIGSFVEQLSDTGLFIIKAGTSNRIAVKAIGLIIKEIQKIAANGITKKEFEEAKRYLEGQMVLALDDPLDLMLGIGARYAQTGIVKNPLAELKAVRSVTYGQVVETGREILNLKSSSLAVVGDLDDNQRRAIEGIING